MNSERYYGKFRGVVTDNEDPLQTGRIRAKVLISTGERECGWATPCFPFAGSGMGFFALPDKQSKVWIEFEQGDLDYPIWTGCYFDGIPDLPPALLAPPYKKVLLKTSKGHSIILDDTPGVGGITFETSGGQKITLSATGIVIDNGLGGKIAMEGPKVTVNGGALEVI